jgi:general secretion pathway protein E
MSALPDPETITLGAGPAEPLSPGYGFSRRSGVLPGPVVNGRRTLYLRADADPMAVLEIRRRSAERLQLEPLSTDEFDRRLREQHERSSNDAMNFVEGLNEGGDLLSVAEALAEPQDLLESEDDAPIIRLINALLTEAVRENASDIHIEPFETRLSVRLRVDGVLREVLNPPVSLAPLIVSRVKVMARLDIAEKRLPQDGRISLRVAGRPVDVRVSTLPSGHGERVVLRLLDKQAGRLELRHLGMAEDQYLGMERVISRPHGIVLVTGPTGSGKTTTLYAALMRLNDRSRNILTVEDPIEYYLDGIGQTQINTRVDMTFARGLRAILRQDPDVVMVGEIRDLETVQIAVQASLTGHLVFSTLHTNSAIGTITRLRDMGVEPFLLASTLNGILAQRLVRMLCTSCRKPAVATHSECIQLGLDLSDPPLIHRARGCPKCNGLGVPGPHRHLRVDRSR